MELDVNKWLQCFSRNEASGTESRLFGTDSDILELTNKDSIKNEKFNLYQFVEKGIVPQPIEADNYYNYYNTQVIRFDVSFLSEVKDDGTLYYTSINNFDQEYSSNQKDKEHLKPGETLNRINNISDERSVNNNYFVGATIEDFGSYKTLNLTLVDRSFVTLSGYIYQAIKLGNGNVRSFGTEKSNSEKEEDKKAKEEGLETELTDTTKLQFIKTPNESKIKQNLKIRYGYQTTTNTNDENNFKNDGSAAFKNMFGESTHRWTTASTWSGSKNINDKSVSPNSVLANNRFQTTKVLPEMDFFITDLSTNLTPKGIVYNIKASSTENFVLNNIKFVQQYTVLRGKPKSLLASLMRVFNSDEKAPVKIVWCDRFSYTNYLNGSEILKNYKTGNFEIMDEAASKDTLQDDRKTLNDIKKQLEILESVKNLFIYSPGNNYIKIGDSDLSYRKLASNIISCIKNKKTISADDVEEIEKHDFSNVFFYPLRKEVEGEGSRRLSDGKIIDPKDEKNIIYKIDVERNHSYFGDQQSSWFDKKLRITNRNIFASWINFIKSKASEVNDPEKERGRELEEYKKFESQVLRREAKERLSNESEKLKIEWNKLNNIFHIESEDGYHDTNNVCGGLLISIPPKDSIHICDLIDFNGEYYDESATPIGMFAKVQPIEIYDTYKSFSENKNLKNSKDYSEFYNKILEDSSVWRNINNVDSNKLLLSNNIDSLYDSLINNKNIMEKIDEEVGNEFLEIYKKYKTGAATFIGYKEVKNDETDILLTRAGASLFKTNTGILGFGGFTIDEIYTKPSSYLLTNNDGNMKIVNRPSNIKESYDSKLETIEEVKSILVNVIRMGFQDLKIKDSDVASGASKKFSNISFMFSYKLDGKTMIEKKPIYSGSDFSEEFKTVLENNSDKIAKVKDVFNFFDSCFSFGDYDGQTLYSLVLLMDKLCLAIKNVKNSGYKTREEVINEEKKFAKSLANYIKSEFKEYIAKYYVTAIDYYWKAKTANEMTEEIEGEGGTVSERSVSWETLANTVSNKIISDGEVTIKYSKGRIKKQGSDDSLSFSEMDFGSSIDGNKNYIEEAYNFIDFNKEPSEVENFISELDEQIKQFSKLKDIINDEYAKLNETKIGKEISISLGSEDSQDKNNMYTKSLSSLFNDFCSQCMPMIKASDVVATSTKDGDGNTTTATITDEASKQNLTWSVVGYYNDEQPIIGFYYKEPKFPKYIRKYEWGNGNSAMHCIKDINISTASEFAMYSTINTMALEDGKITGVSSLNYNNDRRTDVTKISGSDTEGELSKFFPNIVSNNNTQKNIMNNLLKSINKGTITLLGDPSLVFTGEIQPYTYPILLNIKLQQEGTTWSEKPQSVSTVSYLSGIYVVGKITHNFSSSGYTTTLEVIRYPGLDKDYGSVIGNTFKL